MSHWDRRFLELATLVASWSKDNSTKVGCCIVRPDKTVASLGFNGFARGIADLPERLNDREFKLATILHSEENAILHAREPLNGYTIYVSGLPPCSKCSCLLIQAGIKRVVAYNRPVPERWVESMSRASMLLQEAGVQIDLLPE